MVRRRAADSNADYRAIRRARQAEGFETDERDRFGFDFAQTAGRVVAVGQVGASFGGVAEDDVREFVKPGLVGQFGDGRDGD